ncbi:hypothetical protein [Dethiothermospora halolimnae]
MGDNKRIKGYPKVKRTESGKIGKNMVQVNTMGATGSKPEKEKEID